MADITLTVDYEFGQNLGDSVSKLINEINASVPKIKIEFDIDNSAVNNLQKAIKSLNLSGTKNASNIAPINTTGIKNAKSGLGELIKTTTQYSNSSSKAVTLTNEYKNSLDATRTVIKNTSDANGELLSTTTQVTQSYKTQAEESKKVIASFQEMANVEKSYATTFTSIESKQKNLMKAGGLDTSAYSELESYKKTLETLKDEYSKTGDYATYRVGLTELQASFTKTKAAADEFIATQKEVSSAFSEKSASALRQEMANVEKSYATMTDRISSAKKTMERYNGEEKSPYSDLNDLQTRLNSIKSNYDTTGDIKQFSADLTNLQAKFVSVNSAVRDFASERKAAFTDTQTETALKKYISLMDQYRKTIEDYSAAKNSSKSSSYYSNIEKDYEALKMLESQYNNEEISLNELINKVSMYSTELSANRSQIRANGDDHKTLGTRIGDLAQRFSSWLSVSEVIMTAVNSVKKMVTASIELDTAMTELKKVTDESDSTYSKFLENASSRAKELGSSLSDVVTASADFARLGYDIDDASTLADAALVYKNVGDGIDDISEASESIISTLQAFYAGEDNQADLAMSVVDKFNEIGNKYAISSEGVGEALVRSASSMAAANNSLDETIALITGANTVVQDTEKVGTALKTVSMRLRAATTEVEDAGESTDGMASSVSELREELLQLTGNKVDIQIDSDTFKSTYAILQELSEVWGDLSDVSQANILEIVAGKNQSNVVASLLQNFNVAESALETSANSAGSALAENEKYLESVQGKLDAMKASFETLSGNFVSSDFLKFFIEGATGALDLLNSVTELANSFGGLKTVLIAISGLLISSQLTRIGKLFDSAKDRVKSVIEIFSNIPNAISVYTDKTAVAVQGTSKFETALKAMGISASAAQVAINAVTAVLTIAIAAYSKYRQSIEQNRQTQIDAAESALEESKNIIELYDAYQTASNAYALNSGSKGVLMSATMQLIEALGIEGSELDNLISKYGDLDHAMAGITSESMSQAVAAAQTGLKAAYENLQDSIGNGTDIWSSFKKSIGLGDGSEILSWSESSKDLNKKASEILEDAGLIGRSSYGSTGGTMVLDTDDIDGILESYEKLKQARQLLQEGLSTDEYNESRLASTIENKITSFESVLSEYQTAQDTYRDTLLESALFDVSNSDGLNADAIDSAETLLEYKNKLIEMMSDKVSVKDAIEEGYLTSDDISAYVDSYISELSEFEEYYDELDNLSKRALTSSQNVADSLGIDLKSMFGDDTGVSDSVKEAYESYKGIVDEFNSLNVKDPTQTVFGNIDTDSRQRLEWTTEALEKYKSELDSWDSDFTLPFGQVFSSASKDMEEAADVFASSFAQIEGSYSTIYGSYGEYDGVDIAFSPMLQTENGAVLLSAGTVDKYIFSLIDKAGEGWTNEDLLRLDTEGLEIDGQRIKNLIADIGETAAQTSIEMHFTGDTGAIADAYEYLEETINSSDDPAGALQFVKDEAFINYIDDYIVKVNELQKAFSDYSNGNFSNDDVDQLLKNFPQLENYTGDLSTKIRLLLDDMQTDVVSEFSTQFDKVDSEEAVENLQAFQNAVVGLADVVGNTNFTIDFEAETEGMNNLISAMKESVTSTGLTSESISNLKSRYKDLDTSSLFEKTTNGIHLNTKALRELESEYEKQTKNNYDQTLKNLTDEYNYLTEKINSANTAAEASEAYTERSAIKNKIEEVATLAAQYDGLTSAFYKWEQAQSIGEEGDMYDSLAGSLDDIKELYNDGLIGTNKFRTAVQLMTNEDVSNMSGDELISIYQKSYSTMTRYFQDGQNGVLNFLNDLQKLNSEWAHLNEDGSWDINFGIGNDDEIADALGINVESVQAIMRKLSDFDFDINLDSEYSKLELLSTKAEEANDRLKELGKTDYTFSFDSDDLDYIVNDQLPEAQKILDELSAEGVDVDTSELEDAQAIMTNLLLRKQELSAPEIMSIDSTSLQATDADLSNAVASLQEFVTLSNQMEIEATLGVDTSDTQSKIQTVAQDLQNIPDEVKTTLGIDNTDFQTAIDNIANTEIDVKAGVTLAEGDIAAIQASIDGIQAKDITVNTNSDDVTSDLDAINNYKISNKSFTISAIGASSSLSQLRAINSLVLRDKSYTITTHTKTVSDSASADGTAHAQGTAKANGDWRIGSTGTSLGGELKPELVVRDGRWFTIGEDSAEFFHHEKGDIVFNGDQTEQIFKYGKIVSGKKRGQSYADGTAFSSGSGKITAAGKVVTKSTGSSGSSSGSNSSGSNSSSGEDDNTEIIDWIEIAIDRIERAIDNLATIATSSFRKLTERLGATNDEIAQMTSELSLQQQGYDRYIQEANSVGLSEDLAERVRNGAIDINEYDSDTADLISQYQEWYEKALDCSDAILELKESIAELYENKFDDISTDYENQLSLLEHLTNTYNNGIDDLEERGYLSSTKYYEALKEVEQQNIDVYKSELEDLTTQLTESVNSGYIQKYSEAWYDMCQSINDIKESIQESETAIVEFNNSIRELKWDRFDYLQEQISNITEEADFLIDLMENSDLFTDNGQLTDTGMATMGVHGQSYNIYMAQADKYAEELLKLNEELANDPNNTKLIDRQEELIEAQREAILSAEDEKQAIIDLVEEGIDLELDALQDLIDKYEDSLDSAKDLYDYQKKLEEQTSEIASLQKQLYAYSGDNSEETKATIQKLKVQLEEAKSDLEETQYDQYISDTKQLLSNLYDEYEAILNERLDNVDALLSDMIDRINANSSSICETLTSQADKVGYTITENEKSIWSTDGGISNVITKYGDSFLAQFTTVNDVINKIGVKLGAMVTESEKKATTTVASTTKTPTPAKTDTSASNKKDTSTPAKTDTGASKVTNLTDDVKQGVAAAIWIYGATKSGWGNSSNRQKKLEEKFGTDGAKAVQDYINAHGSNGDLYKYWTNSGKGNLSQYYYSAFKKGGLADYTGIAWLDGSPTDPEMVLNPKDTANFIALKDAMSSIANGTSPLASLFGGGSTNSLANNLLSANSADEIADQLKSIASSGNNSNNTSISYEVTIPIEHVQDYDDFMNQMRKDGKFEKMIQSMTVDRIVGGSKLAKNKYTW